MDKRKKRLPVELPALKPTGLRAIQRQGAPMAGVEPEATPGVWQMLLDLSDPLLANHRVQGANVLPGAVYVDLFYQALVHWGWRLEQTELRDLAIHNPLAVGSGERYRLCVEMPAHPGNELHITSLREGSDAAAVRLASVTAVPMPALFLPALELAVGELRQSRGAPISDSYGYCESQGLAHRGVMRADGSVLRRDGQIFLQLSAADAARRPHVIDPVLLDAMGVALAPFLLEAAGEDHALFLPLLYGRLQLLAPLRTACIACIDSDGIRVSEDLVRCGVRFFSETGEALALLTDFTCKRVRPGQTVTATPRRSGTPRGSTPGAPPPLPPALVEQVQLLVAAELGCAPDQVELDAGYYALGLHSSSLLAIFEKLKAALDLPLSPTLFFEYTTIQALAAHLVEQYPALQRLRADRPADMRDRHSERAIGMAGDADPGQPPPAPAEAFAIIGLAGRFPQAPDVATFWQNLVAARDLVTEVPAERWQWQAFAQVALPSGRPVSRWGGFVDEVDAFDPLFFRIAPREAEAMDPQERLFLDVCWEAIENAGYVPERLGGASRAVGVYAGVMHKDYAFVGAEVLAQGGSQTPLSLNYAAIANRVSYCFDFRGPSITVDTVCSASLTAVHFACESLRSGECDVAVAGGVNLSLHPNKYISYGLMGLHSSDGRCRAFGQGGDGYVSAEAVAAVVLKPLRLARQDNDTIYATILASGINHVGKGSGITVPDPAAQSALIQRCLRRAGVHPASIGYIETHGTGTVLGDPIEIRALATAFAAFPAGETPAARCALGSVKSNLGHAEAAAGITGLIKAVLQLHHRQLVPSIHCDPVNPYLGLDATPFHIQRAGEPWPALAGQARRSGVNSIGATGSNAFVLLEEAAPRGWASRRSTPLPVLLPLSAHDPQRLDAYARAVLSWLERHRDEIDLPSLAFTLQQGRQPLKARLCLVASSAGQAITRLRSVLDGTFRPDQAATAVVARQAPARSGTAEAGIDATTLAIQEGDYAALARHWCNGEPLAWEQWPVLFAGHNDPSPPVVRLALPTVPRLRQSFWIGGERRPAGGVVQERPAEARPHRGNALMLAPVWEPADPADLAAAAATSGHSSRLVLGRDEELAGLAAGPADHLACLTFGESINELVEKLAAAGAPGRVLLLAGTGGGPFPQDLPRQLEQTVGFVFRLVKALLHAGYAGRPLEWTVVTRQAVQVDGDPAPDPAQAALHGLAGVVAKEYPRWRVRVVDLARGAGLAPALDVYADLPGGEAVALRAAMPWRQRLAQVRFTGTDTLPGAYRRGGVYVVIGGAGGLGTVLTAYLRERYQAQVVWIGRRRLDAGIAGQLKAQAGAGPAPVYLSVDATDAPQLASAFAEVSARFGAIHGVVHSAMGDIDASVDSMDEARFRASSRPKIDICLSIARALATLTPDFILFFSSINAFARDHGKAGYATANTFEDAFALRLAEHTTASVKVVNWGWWEETGVSQDLPAPAITRMRRLGLAGIEPVQAMRDLEFLLSSPLRQLAVLGVDGSGEQFASARQELTVDLAAAAEQRLRWMPRPSAASAAAAVDRATVAAAVAAGQEGEAGLLEPALAVFAHLLADALKLPPAQIDPHEPMEAYGIDSILIVQMTQVLERHLDAVSSTLFFEHKTLHALASHFLRTQPERLRALLAAQLPAQAAAAPARATAPPPVAAALPASATPPTSYSPIAIIGLHGRFPQADDLGQFWENLRAGRDCITRVPEDRWDGTWFDPHGIESAIDSGRSYCDQGGFMAGFADFDSDLFGILPNMAQSMDPQERWFLQSCWLALEDAGYTPESLRHNARVGVYAGVTKTGFELYLPALAAQGESLLPHTSFSSVANQVSYLFDFSGPSLPVDTMCSAALTAIHEACESLHRGACDVAIAGGVNLYLHPHNYVYLCRARMLAGDGRCKSFAAGADGFVPGEGVGTVLLKPLARAEADGDAIRAVIIASHTNHGGKTNGYTVPNPQAQQSLVQEALRRAGIDPRSISYVEAHGTGTALGDPIEVKALQAAFSAAAREFGVPLDNWRCAIGSVKSNIGHLEAAAGMAGLAKAVLQLQHRELVPSLHAESTNPAIAFGPDGFFLQRTLSPWDPAVDSQGRPQPRRAALSAFGAGGANAHLILQEYPALPHGQESAPLSGPALVPLSAATPAQLLRSARALRDWIEVQPAGPDLLKRVAYTLQCGRVPMAQRLGVVAGSIGELAAGLEAYIHQQPSPQVLTGEVHRGGQAGHLARLLADEDLDPTVSAWLSKGKHRRLLDAWCNGLRVDWRRLYASGAPPRRVALPGYPLAAQRYWLPDRLQRARAPAASAGMVEPVRQPATPAADIALHRASLFAAMWQGLDGAVATASGPRAAKSHVWVIDAGALLADATLAGLQADYQVRRLQTPGAALAEVYAALARQLKSGLSALLSAREPCCVHVLLVAAAIEEAGDGQDLIAHCSAGLAGLLFSASEEAPWLETRCFSVAGDVDSASLYTLLRSGEAFAPSLHFRWRAGRTEYRSLRLLEPASATAAPVWRHQGVYLISGGLGALGRGLVAELRRCQPAAALVLLGRRALDAAGQDYLDHLRQNGGPVDYVQADVACAEQVAAAVKQLRQRHAQLHGVIHCAGQLADAGLLRADDAMTDAAFAAKVQGLVNLDVCTAGFELDFFVAYSSIASLGNPGQADYAAANGFMNHYLRQRRKWVADGIRHGRPVSINWPFWACGGMQLDTAGEHKLQTTGMAPLDMSTGLAQLHRILTDPGADTDYYVFFGDPARLDVALAARFPHLADAAAGVAARPFAIVAPADGSADAARIGTQLAELLAVHTGLQAAQVDVHRRLEEYGIDSVLIAALNRSLAPHFPVLSKTLFYQFQTLDEAARHLLATYPGDCARWLSPVTSAAAPAAAQACGPASAPSIAGVSPAAAAPSLPQERGEALRRRIAIIGLAGRYPDAPTLEQFWQNLAAGRESIQSIPAQRWPLQGFYEPDVDTAVAAGRSYSQWGGFVDGFDEFDYLFFGMAPAEVQCIDPQERLFIQCCWHAVENAGYTPRTLSQAHAGSVGVFAGITKTGFDLYGPDLWRQGDMRFPYTSFSSVANRISYLFDLHGPSMPVDTMCSSSLTAIHQAVESIRRGECAAAIAGGVNLYLHPSAYVGLCARKMLSPDGHCRSFGAGGSGFVPGEGVGAVLLKDLAAAERDGDPVHALIAGSAVNHGGRTHGFTVPSPAAQAAVIAGALGDAGLHAEQIDYVEAHGTGTELGDPIEVTGLSEGFARSARSLPLAAGRCVLGAVKANIGHLEAAAGIAGLTKVVLQMKHAQWLPGLHIEQANPDIAFGQSPFRLQRSLAEWPAGTDGLRRAGLSSFGAGGSNAHLVLESYLPAADDRPAAGSCLPGLLLLSADSAGQVREMASRLHAFAAGQVHTAAALADFLYTLQVGRAARAVRAAAWVATPDGLRQQLQCMSSAAGDDAPGILWHEVLPDAAAPSLAQLQARLVALPSGDHLLALQRWLQNQAVDWSPQWKDRNGQLQARRQHLPGYVFRPDRFWLKDALASPGSYFARPAAASLLPQAAAVPPPAADAAAQTLLFTETLQARPLPSSGLHPAGPVLYFALQEEHRQAVAQAFGRRGDAVAFATPPAAELADAETGADSLACRHFSAELSRFAAAAGCAFSVVFAWPLEQPQRLQDVALLVELLRSIKLAGCVQRLVLAVPYFTAGDAACSNAYAEGWEGLRRSLAVPLAHTPVVVVSQAVAAQIDWQDWAQRLHDELGAGAPDSVRFTAAGRLVYETQEVTLQPGRQALREAGTYLITGGAGGLGRAMALHLLRQHRAHVVLLGRSPPSSVDTSAWSLREDEAARIHYLQADVADAAALARAVEAVERTHARIDGVIHAAGVVPEQALFDLSADQFRAVLRPKIEGTLAIAEVFGAREPDFILYMGSAAALLGDFGSGNYALANRFMAHCALAAGSPARRTRHQAICWPLWQDGGMGREDSARTGNFLAASGQCALETGEALALLERLLGAQFGQFLVLRGDPARLRARAAAAAAATAATAAAPQAAAGSSTLLALVKRHIAGIVGIPVERIEGSEPFIDLGFDSVHLAQLARSIGAALSAELAPTELFTHSSPRALSRFLAGRGVPLPQAQDAGLVGRTVASPVPAAGAAGTPAPIAIIGISGLFPCARSLDVMWDSLQNGFDHVEEISTDRFLVDAYYDPANRPGTTCSRWLGRVPGEAEFDAQFFELSPVEAEEIDPRQRLLLQECWKALEHAGYGAEACARHTIGVFVGVEQGDYQQFLDNASESANTLTTNHDAILAARLSYQLDLHGPVLSINTACSSGLVAAHQACQSLRSGECDTALAASAQLLLSPRTLVAMSQAGMLSPTGRCRAFDAQADGIVAGEAVVALVLKPLEKARADNDPVLAVIAGSGINYDGRTNGITAPSGASQQRLIETVYRNHAIDPADISYVLAHGTGTRLGDPVEVNALAQAFRTFTAQRGYCALGSTKSNFGHTFAASGLVSVAVMVKALQHRVIPPSLHCNEENELVDWAASPFYVNKRTQAWQHDPARPRLGAVSAFGMSGTNAHLVIGEAAPAPVQPVETAEAVLLLLSAKSRPALERKIEQIRDYCRAADLDQQALVRLGYTLSVCRHHFRHRFGLAVRSAADAIARLDEAVAQRGQERHAVARDFEPDPAVQDDLNRSLEQAQAVPPVALLSAYLQGYDLAWSRGYGGRRLRPLPAPGYPFSTRRYWTGGRTDEPAGPAARDAAAADPVWQALAQAAALQPSADAAQPASAPAFDAAFYTSLLSRLADNEMSVDDAIRHTRARTAASPIGEASD